MLVRDAQLALISKPFVPSKPVSRLSRMGLELRVFSCVAAQSNESVSSRHYWFRCPECERIVVNYRHGFDRYLPCPFCEFFRRLELSESRERAKKLLTVA